MLQDAETTKEPIEGKLTEDDVRRIVREEVERAFKRDPAARRASIIASKGTLDWAYPPLILATTAAAADMDTSIFFTFYGLSIIHKDFAKKLKVDPVGNPAMPMPVPIPDIVASLPGMVPLASTMMRSRFATHNVATIGELVDARDLLCPMPVLATTKQMRLLEPGQVLKVLATDRGALADIPAWAEDTGNQLLATAEEDGALVFWIRKASDA